MNTRTAQRTKFIRVMKIISLSALLPTRSIVSTCAASMESLDRSKSKDCTRFSILPRLSTGRTLLSLSHTCRQRFPSFVHLSLSLFSHPSMLLLKTSSALILTLHEIIDLYAHFLSLHTSPFFVVLLFAQFLIAIVENLYDRYQTKC